MDVVYAWARNISRTLECSMSFPITVAYLYRLSSSLQAQKARKNVICKPRLHAFALFLYTDS